LYLVGSKIATLQHTDKILTQPTEARRNPLSQFLHTAESRLVMPYTNRNMYSQSKVNLPSLT